MLVERLCVKERINESGPYILVEWSLAKEKINERKPYIVSNGRV